jgi:purine catabolism regulator
MAISLKKIIQLPCFEHVKIIAGESSICHKEVTGVTIVEAPDIAEWIKGGELLLTSLYNFHSDYERQKEMVIKLAEKGAAGLIVKISRFVKDVPEIIIETGNIHGLPIFELPGEVKYIDILYPVMSELFNRQLVILEHYKKCHNRFIELSLNDGNLKEITKELSTIIHHPVVLYDYEFKVLSTTEPQFSTIMNTPKITSKLTDNTTLDLYKQNIIFEVDDQKIESEFVITPLHVLEHIRAYLAVDILNNPLTEMDFVAIETAVSNISLTLVKQRAIQEIEYRFKNDIMDDIIHGRYSSEDDIDLRAKAVGWNLNAPHVLLLVQLQHFGKNLLEEKNVLKRKESISRILMVINSTAAHYVKSPIVISKSDRFLILLPTQNLQSQSVKRFADELHQNIKSQIHNVSTTIGIGTEVSRITDIRKSFQEALNATAFGQLIYGNEVVIQYDQLGVYRLLCHFDDPEELKRFIHPAVITLSKYDSDKNNDLIRTLEVYLGHNANAKKTAEELFIHYKTVQYRINRIREIMGIDFEEKQFKLEIEMGVKILNLLEKKKL